jgi:glucose-6-phosphate-specific signal transduction histidine kinase
VRTGILRDKRLLLRLIEDERRRLGDELHDSLGQQVTGIAFLAKTLEQKLATARGDEAANLAERLVEKANRLTEQVGYLAQRLQEPEAIRASEFCETLENWARNLRDAFGVQCVVAIDAVDLPNGEMTTALFRLVREMAHEALARCARDAEIKVEMRPGRRGLDLAVSCERSRAKWKTSILLRLRAELVGARLRAANDDSRWILRAAVPLNARRR